MTLLKGLRDVRDGRCASLNHLLKCPMKKCLFFTKYRTLYLEDRSIEDQVLAEESGLV